MLLAGAGIDIWKNHPGVVGWCVVNGLIGLGAIYGALTGIVLWARRSGRDKLARAIEASTGGRSVKRAQALLEEIERFERE